MKSRIIVLSAALAFFAVGVTGAEAASAKKCPNKALSAPKTIKATYIFTECGGDCSSEFRLANGKTMDIRGDARKFRIKEGQKVSVTYQVRQFFFNEYDDGGTCLREPVLQNVKRLK